MIIWATIIEYYILNICESNPHKKVAATLQFGGWLFCLKGEKTEKCIMA